MSETISCSCSSAQSTDSSPTTEQQSLHNQRLDDLTAEIAVSLARLRTLYALRAEGVNREQDGTPQMAYCSRCGENTVLDPDLAPHVSRSPHAMTQSTINIRIAAARVWKRQAGLAARITSNHNQL
jgi:hypothetical protein